jgi:SNF2 family DNA or RNA helicase
LHHAAAPRKRSSERTKECFMATTATHPGARALAILTGQCDGAVALDNVGLNKLHAARYREELLSGYHNFDWWACALPMYHRQLPADLVKELQDFRTRMESVNGSPFTMRRYSNSHFTVVVCFARKDEAKEKVFKITGKRALIWDSGSRSWQVHQVFIPALVQSGMFTLEEEERAAKVVQEIEQYVKERDAYNAKRATTADPIPAMPVNVDIPSMGLAYPPFAFQASGVNHLAPTLATGNVMLADDMGLGKTLQAMILAIHSQLQVVVICPASLQYNWVSEVFKHTKDKTVHVLGSVLRQHKLAEIYGSNASRFCNMRDADYVIMSYERTKNITQDNPDPETAKYHTMRRAIRNEYADCFKTRLCVIDEFHYAKNKLAKRTQNTAAVVRACRRAVAMTGTPIENHPAELWPILCAIGRNRDLCANKAEFDDRFVYGGDYAELHRRLTSAPWYLRRRKVDVLKDLPPKLRGEFVVEMTPAFSAAYANALAGIAVTGQPMSNRLRILTELQTIANAAKVLPVAAYLKDRAEEGKATVVQCTRTAPLKEIKEWLNQNGIAAELLIGETPKLERVAICDAFQAGALKVVLTTLREGITLTAADTLLLLDIDWTPSKITQREDRIYRIGQLATSVSIYRVVAAGIDHHKLEVVASKQEIVSACLDGQPYSITETELVGQVLRRLEEDAGIAHPSQDQPAITADDLRAIDPA